MRTREELARGYDRLAPAFARRFRDELDYKPYDRSLLQRFAELVAPGPVGDVGCGPGQIGAYLAAQGRSVIGVDLSPRMIAEAERQYPSLDFRVGDVLKLPIDSASLAGLVAFYSIIHLEANTLVPAFCEMNRVIQPKGLMLVSFHKGVGELHVENVLGSGVAFDCNLFEPDQVTLAMEQAGFFVTEVTTRRPYQVEFPTQRVYVLAEK